MKILIADKFEQQGIDALRAAGCSVECDPTLQDNALTRRIAELEPDGLIVRSTKVPADALAACPGLRLVIRAGSGVDNVDLEAASRLGIGVCNCPGMNAIAVAELVMGLLISCDRRIPDQTADLRSGSWRKKEYGRAKGLKGRTLGVVGVGYIGEALIPRAAAFGMEVVGWSRGLTEARAATLGVGFGGNTRRDLLEMLSRCDAVSVHIALNDQTRGFCNTEFFDAMPDSAYFINTARGGVVDGEALERAVRERGMRCGLDVYAQHPTPNDTEFHDPIVGLPGVYGAHHCGASTEQAQLAVADEAVRIVTEYKSSGRYLNRVNAEPATPVVRAAAKGNERVTS